MVFIWAQFHEKLKISTIDISLKISTWWVNVTFCDLLFDCYAKINYHQKREKILHYKLNIAFHVICNKNYSSEYVRVLVITITDECKYNASILLHQNEAVTSIWHESFLVTLYSNFVYKHTDAVIGHPC